MRAHRAVLIAAGCLASLALAAGAVAPVADAARSGDRTAVRALLRDGADVNAAQGDGMTALHWAALHGDVEMAEVLLYAGANLHATTRVGAYTPLLVASRQGQPGTIGVLLEAGASPDSATANGTSALMLASAAGSDEAIRVLLAAGADVNAREIRHGQTALIFAAAANQVQPITTLVEAGADPNLASLVVDVVQEEQKWREAFVAKGREAAVRRRLAEAEREARETKPDGDPAEKSTEELEGEEKSEPAEAESESAGEGETAQAAEPQDNEAAQAAANEQSEDPELGGLPLGAAAQAQPAETGSGAETASAAASAATHEQDAEAEAGQQPAGTDGGAAESAAADDETDADSEEKVEPTRRLSYGELIDKRGGLTPLHHAARQGHIEAAQALLELGSDIDQRSADGTSPLLIATINGHFDLAMFLLAQGADATAASTAGATPLYATLNVQWAPKSLYPQPRAFGQQQTTHLELMTALLDAGVDPNVRLERKIWYSGYNFDLSGVNEGGATPFWRAAYAGDVAAMRLLVEHGADPSIPTRKPPGRPRTGDATREIEDHSGLPPVPVGGPAVTPLQAAAGVGYGEGFAANSHRHAPGSWMPAVRYLVEELGADVNASDHEGNTALHHAAARGDNEMILYLVERGADVTAVSREGNTVADMANGPVQRIQPFPETVALLESLGSKNNNKCVSC